MALFEQQEKEMKSKYYNNIVNVTSIFPKIAQIGC